MAPLSPALPLVPAFEVKDCSRYLVMNGPSFCAQSDGPARGAVPVLYLRASEDRLVEVGVEDLSAMSHVRFAEIERTTLPSEASPSALWRMCKCSCERS